VTSEVIYICEGCSQQLNPPDSSVVFAVQLLRSETFDGVEFIEGLGVFFHAGCYPNGSPDYREKPKPDAFSA
jgi:hypothetical protein